MRMDSLSWACSNQSLSHCLWITFPCMGLFLPTLRAHPSFSIRPSQFGSWFGLCMSCNCFFVRMMDHKRRWHWQRKSSLSSFLLCGCSAMSSLSKPTFICLVFIVIASFSCSSDPVPASWPLQFHSVLFMNKSGSLELIDLWYDWPNGRNFNIIQSQQGKLLYDLEWNNGTSFFYTLDSNRECSTTQFQVGILRPDWLVGATYLGQRHVDGFLCNVWEKVDFIWYYEDVVTKRPVHWVFYTGREAHVMTFEVGAVLEDLKWQAPVYCFDENPISKPQSQSAAPPAQVLLPHGRFPINAAGF